MSTRIERIRNGRATALALRLGLILGLGVLVYPACAHAVEVWSTDEEFTYGFLIPPIAVGILCWRRNALRQAVRQGRETGLLIVGISIILMLVSASRLTSHSVRIQFSHRLQNSVVRMPSESVTAKPRTGPVPR